MFWKLGHLDFEFVSDWSLTDASPDIRISDFFGSNGFMGFLTQVILFFWRRQTGRAYE